MALAVAFCGCAGADDGGIGGVGGTGGASAAAGRSGGAPGLAGAFTGGSPQGTAGGNPNPSGGASGGRVDGTFGGGVNAAGRSPAGGAGAPAPGDAGRGGAGGGGGSGGRPGPSSGSGGMNAAAGAGGASAARPETPPVVGTCPELKSGAANVLGASVQLWVGSKPGPLYFYWHGTGQSYTEVERGMPGATAGVSTAGGIVASFDATSRRGTNTGNGVWYTGDFEAADQILACGARAGLVDTARVYTAGYSAGGLQACAMVTQRGRYLAAAICYSGGAATVRGTPQDTRNLPPTLLLHGAAGSDAFILDFHRASRTWAMAYAGAGGFVIDCDDGGDHVRSAGTRLGFGGRAMKFFAAHPFGVRPEPYAAGLPSDWPDYCSIEP